MKTTIKNEMKLLAPPFICLELKNESRNLVHVQLCLRAEGSK